MENLLELKVHVSIDTNKRNIDREFIWRENETLEEFKKRIDLEF